MFENVLSNVLTKLVFHVEKPMNDVSFVDVETIDSNYSNCVSIFENRRDLIRGVEILTDRQIYTVSRIVRMKPPV